MVQLDSNRQRTVNQIYVALVGKEIHDLFGVELTDLISQNLKSGVGNGACSLGVQFLYPP
jgi:hypothetical protein